MDVDEFKEIFAEEAITHLTAFERGILALEKNAADRKAGGLGVGGGALPGQGPADALLAADREAINDIFRAVHTLKGASGMVGLGATSRFSHAAESFLDGVRAGTQGLDRERVSTLLAVHDALRLLIEKEISGNIGVALESEVTRLTNWLKGQVPGDAAPAAAVAEKPIHTGGAARYFLRIDCDARMAQNGFDPLSFIRYLKNAGTITDCRVLPAFPEKDSFDPELLYLGFEVVLETEKNAAEIRDIFSLAGDLVKVAIGEEKRAEPRPTEPAAKQQAVETEAQKKNYLRVESGRLDALIDSIGELVMTGAALRSLQPEGADERYLDQMTLLERQVERMRDTAMSLRTFSLSEVFRRFERIVRDVSAEAGKEIELEIHGGDTEIDKNLMDGVYDPLVHIIRNSIDHGIESREERVRKGKSATGKITVHTEHVAGMIYISVEDDGGGPNLAKIEQRARERGLLKEGQPTEKELIEMVFQPGFSTAEKVTSLSGRGVGMDVVRQNVMRLNGSVNMARAAAGGTIVSIRLPLTLAIIDGLLVQAGHSRYIIPLDQVIECVDYDAMNKSDTAGIFNLRGEPLPVVPLGEMFSESDNHPRVVAVVQSSGSRRGILIDRPLGEMQIVVKPIENIPGIPRLFNGATVLGNGQVALILDLTSLFQSVRPEAENIQRGEVAPGVLA